MSAAKGKILIVGRGTLGTAAQNSGWAAGYETLVATRSAEKKAEKLDITSADVVRDYFEHYGPFDAVINCSAEANVDACENDPEHARQVNALGVKALAEACRKCDAAFLHVSTDYVFSGLPERPWEPGDYPRPCSVYGISKLEGEYYARTIPRVGAVVRTTWIFGGKKNDFVNAVAGRVRADEPLASIDNQQASPTFSVDLAQALGTLLETVLLPARRCRERFTRVYHVTNSGVTTRRDMAAQIAAILGKPQEVRRIVPEDLKSWLAVRPEYTVLSAASFEKDTGMKMRPWNEALKDFLKA